MSRASKWRLTMAHRVARSLQRTKRAARCLCVETTGEMRMYESSLGSGSSERGRAEQETSYTQSAQCSLTLSRVLAAQSGVRALCCLGFRAAALPDCAHPLCRLSLVWNLLWLLPSHLDSRLRSLINDLACCAPPHCARTWQPHSTPHCVHRPHNEGY